MGDPCVRGYSHVIEVLCQLHIFSHSILSLCLYSSLHARLGGFHTCAVMSDGTLQCWGGNLFGALGYGDAALRSSPGGNVPVGARVAHVSAGLLHTCVVLVTTAVRCWGLNSNGQLGYGDLVDRCGE